MKKDYISVSAAEGQAANNNFSEHLWTGRFNKNDTLIVRQIAQRQKEYRFVQRFLPRVPTGGRILDGGCGAGEWVVYFNSLGFQVVGLDISRLTIDHLQEKFPECQFVCGDVRHTDFADASFDAYYSWGTFEHFENGLEDCIREAWRILKPSGLLMMSVPYQNWSHILRDARPLHKWDPSYDPRSGYCGERRFYQWRLTRPELHRELAMRGFRVLAVEPLSNQGGVSKWLRATLPWIKQGTTGFRVALRLLSLVMPRSYISHMLIAAAEKVDRQNPPLQHPRPLKASSDLC